MVAFAVTGEEAQLCETNPLTPRGLTLHNQSQSRTVRTQTTMLLAPTSPGSRAYTQQHLTISKRNKTNCEGSSFSKQSIKVLPQSTHSHKPLFRSQKKNEAADPHLYLYRWGEPFIWSFVSQPLEAWPIRWHVDHYKIDHILRLKNCKMHLHLLSGLYIFVNHSHCSLIIYP